MTILEFYKKILFKYLTKTGLFSIIILALFLAALIFKTGVEIEKVENGKFAGTKIITADTTYTSTKTYYFIGKTEKFVFIYNANDSTTNIIATESIKLMILKNR